MAWYLVKHRYIFTFINVFSHAYKCLQFIPITESLVIVICF